MLNGIGAAAARRHSFVVCAGVATVGLVALLAMRPALAAYEVVTVTNGGTIDGVVTLSGAAPTGAPIKVTKNQDYCGQSIPDPAYTVDSSGGLANVIVYLKDVAKGKAASTEPPALGNGGSAGQDLVRGHGTSQHPSAECGDQRNHLQRSAAVQGILGDEAVAEHADDDQGQVRRTRVEARVDPGARASVLRDDHRRRPFHHQRRPTRHIHLGGVARGCGREVSPGGGGGGPNRKTQDHPRSQIIKIQRRE